MRLATISSATGAEVAGLDPPALAPPAGDNGDGDNYGIAGVQVAVTFHNSITGLSETDQQRVRR